MEEGNFVAKPTLYAASVVSAFLPMRARYTQGGKSEESGRISEPAFDFKHCHWMFIYIDFLSRIEVVTPANTLPQDGCIQLTVQI